MKSLTFYIVGFLLMIFSIEISGQEITTLKDSFKLSGSAGVQLTAYNSNGIESRRNPFSYLINGNITLSKGEFAIPLSFTYSEQERSFSQPFNEFGIAPTYKWLKAYIGYQNVNWSKFSMAGHQLLGGGLELTPGKLRFGIIAGRFQRATKIDSTKSREYLPAYKRTGFAAKIGYGTNESYLDLIYLRTKDVDQSLKQAYSDSNTLVQPGANNVLSLKSEFKLASFANLYGEAALSVYNRNINALEKEPDEDWDKFALLIGKQSTATQVYFGMEAGSDIFFSGQNINLYYKRIAPDYQSMGAYYIENDLNAYGFRHSFGLMKGKLSFNYGLGVFHDNLANKKPVTTYRYQPNINLSLNPSPLWGIDASWMDLYTRQKDGFTAVNDSIIMQNRNPGFTISPRLNWGDTAAYHMIMGNYINMRMIDNNAYTAAYMEYSAEIINIMYTLTLMKWHSSMNVSVNRTKNVTNLFTETGYGGSMGYYHTLMSGKLIATATIGLQFSDFKNNYTGNIGLNYMLNSKNNFGLNISLLNNKSKNINTKNFTEFIGSLRYTINF